MRKILFLSVLAFFLLAGCAKKIYKVTVIELVSVGCEHCEKIKPMVEELKREFRGKADFQLYDVTTDEGSKKAALYGLNGTPTFIFLDEKKIEYFRLENIIQKDVIAALINSHLNPPATIK